MVNVGLTPLPRHPRLASRRQRFQSTYNLVHDLYCSLGIRGKNGMLQQIEASQTSGAASASYLAALNAQQRRAVEHGCSTLDQCRRC